MAATSPTNAWAVGRYHNGTTTQTLIEHWNGTAWKREPSPNHGGSTTENTLVGVAATSPTNAWAVGSYGREPNLHTLVLHWNGTAWKIQPSPSPSYASLSSVAATSPTDAWAVGSRAAFTRTLIEHWNGRVWQVLQSPSPGMGADLFSVTATSGKNAWAVGGITDESGRPVRTVIERWNGRAWTVQRNPRLGGAQLYGVAATSAKNAWAVGSYYPSYTSHALIERWNGRVWQVQKHRYPGGRTRDNGLDSVAATSSTNAWAVGFYRGKQRHLRTLALHWNGTAWCP